MKDKLSRGLEKTGSDVLGKIWRPYSFKELIKPKIEVLEWLSDKKSMLMMEYIKAYEVFRQK